ncbi:MAG: hypothetical protein QM764_21430 [Chitinophagaceae bacterium]
MSKTVKHVAVISKTAIHPSGIPNQFTLFLWISLHRVSGLAVLEPESGTMEELEQKFGFPRGAIDNATIPALENRNCIYRDLNGKYYFDSFI